MKKKNEAGDWSSIRSLYSFEAGAKSHVCLRLKNKQDVNGSTDTDADADCRLLVHGLGLTA